jgi:hypothetical protein
MIFLFSLLLLSCIRRADNHLLTILFQMMENTGRTLAIWASKWLGKGWENTKIINYYHKNRWFVRFTYKGDATGLPDFQTDGEMKGNWKAEYGSSEWGDNPLKSLEESEFQSVLYKCISD